MILTKTDKTIKAFEKEIKRLLKEGKTAKEAVKEAYKKYPVMKTLEKELQKQLEEEMKRGAGEEMPITAIHDALSMVWSPDNLTLSERTTKGGKEITAQAASIIAEAIKKGKSVQKTALALFDGYGYGHVLPTQGIPEFMKKLTEIGRITDYKGREFRKTLREVERQLKRVNVQGMKIAYGKIKEAIETGNEKKINKAVYVATQERTRYFARRIARTELARAYGDGAMAKWENDEDCVAFQWKLSTGHPFCDICDLYAHADLYGMGPGIFPKDKVPRLPVHPNCMCHLRPIMEGSKLLQGKEKEQIDKGGMAYIKTLDKHDQERLLGVHGRLEVLKKGNWIEKARGYSAGYMQSRIENGTINDKIYPGEKELIFICNIPKNVYSVVVPDIRTEEVIITENRIKHIRTRHPNDYELICNFFASALMDPEYIFSDSRPNTALVLSRVAMKNIGIKIVLRLQAVTDPGNYKNSIITAQKISEKRYQQYLRNGVVLYRRGK